MEHLELRARFVLTVLSLAVVSALIGVACARTQRTTVDHAVADVASLPGESNDISHAAAGHGAPMTLVEHAAATHIATSSGSWADATTWQNGALPVDGSRVLVPAGTTVTVNQVLGSEFKTVRVDGTLRFDPLVDTELRVDTLVTAPTGTLEMGTAAAPVASGVVARVVFADDGPIDKQWDPSLLSRGALLHGKTVIHGSEKRAFAAVSEFPVAGDTSIHVSEAPLGWQPGDTIVIAGTDPSDPTSDEQRSIRSIDGNVVQLHAPLDRDHRAPRPDLEVHVANLTRNVQFVSENPDVARRGHVMVMHTNEASIDYAWFDGLGRSDKAAGYDDIEFIDLNPYIPARVLGGDNVRGRYSLHFHRGGTDPGGAPATVNGSVVSNDPGWAFVNHSSHVDFTNNVAHDIVGAAYYTEAGDEIGSFIGNIAIRIVNPNMPLKSGPEGEEFDPDAREHLQDYGFQGDGMWLHSPNVRVEDNVFSGTSGHAFIVWPEGLLERNADGSTSKVFHDNANVRGGELIGPNGTRMQLMDVPVGSFSGNQAYSVTRGVQLFYLHTEFFGGELHVEDCTIDPPAQYDDQLRSTFTDSTIWNVDQVGFAAPYTNRITIDGLRFVGDGTADTIGIDVGHFMNERGVEIRNVAVEGFGTGVRISATADVTLGASELANTTDVQYVMPEEDGPGMKVSGPEGEALEPLERDNSHLASCTPGQPPADMELEFEEDASEVRLLAIGDSVLDFSGEESTPEQVGRALRSAGVSAQVVNRAIGGSCLRNCGEAPEEKIPARYVDGDWTHVLISGGGNDLGEVAEFCSSPDPLMSADLQSGAMVDLVDRVSPDAMVILYRYSVAVPEERLCPQIATLMRRYEAFAAERSNVILADATAVTGPETPELWADEVHPNEEGSRAIGQLIADLIVAAR